MKPLQLIRPSLATLFALAMAVPTYAQQASSLPSPYPYPVPAWSPYLAGGLIGVLVLLTLALASKKVGASSAYADVSGLFLRVVAPWHVGSLSYYRENKPQVGWTLVFVLGAIGGALLAAWTGGELTGRYLQQMWEVRFGTESYVLRTVVALLGGGLMAFGARLAGGCTSGHGISGTLQLAVGSWISVICFFLGGMAAALLIYRL